MSFEWKLRNVMAVKGVWKASELHRMLIANGSDVSYHSIVRMVVKLPERLDTQILFDVCAALNCTPNDIMVIKETRTMAVKEMND